jgi:hypothetical protein
MNFMTDDEAYPWLYDHKMILSEDVNIVQLPFDKSWSECGKFRA